MKEHFWKILLVIGSIGFVYSIFQYNGGSYSFEGLPPSSAGIPFPYDIIGSLSVGLIVIGILIRKK